MPLTQTSRSTLMDDMRALSDKHGADMVQATLGNALLTNSRVITYIRELGFTERANNQHPGDAKVIGA